MSERPARVRIIAASANAVFADRLAAALHALGFEIVSGEDARGLNDAVVVVWSGAALSSKGLIDAALAPLRDNILVPVSIGRVEPPPPFRSLRAIDLAGWAGERGDPRLSALAEAVRRGGVPPSPAAADSQTGALSTAQAAPSASEVGDLFAEEESGLRATAPAAPRPPPRKISPAAAVLSLGALGLVGAFAALVAASSWRPPAPENTAAREGADPGGEGPPAVAHIAPANAPDTEERPDDPPPAPEKTGGDDPHVLSESEAAAENGPPPLRDGPVEAPEAKIPPAPSLAASGPFSADTGFVSGVFRDCAECPEMAVIPAGTLLMGSPAAEPSRNKSEGPQTEVRLAHGFAIATRETTFDDWEACVADGACGGYEPPNHGWGEGLRPVVSVSWRDAEAYVGWLSRKTGERYRLPTEAEWEYAARAGGQTPFFFGTAVSPEQANFNGRMTYGASRGVNRRKTTEVASFAPNGFGLYDMHGNVWEWVADCWAPDHADAPADGSAMAAADCGERTLKGGAWNSGGWRLRAAHRIGKPETAREFDIGLRVARDLD